MFRIVTLLLAVVVLALLGLRVLVAFGIGQPAPPGDLPAGPPTRRGAPPLSGVAGLLALRRGRVPPSHEWRCRRGLCRRGPDERCEAGGDLHVGSALVTQP